MKAQIPWLRVFVEGAVIVGSILLAFGLQAWWDGVQEREEEQRVLVGLEADFAQSQVGLHQVIDSHEAMVARIARLEAMSEAERAAVSPDSMWVFVEAMLRPMTFDGRDGTLDAVIASGGLVTISDPRLRDLLVEWQRLQVDVSEEATRLYDISDQVMRRVVQLRGPSGIPPAMVAYAMPGLPDARSHYETADLDMLASDSALTDLVQLKMIKATVYLSEIRPMADHTDTVLTLIRANRR